MPLLDWQWLKISCVSTDSIVGVSVALCPYDNYGFSDQELSLQDYRIDSITRGLFDVPFHCLTACIMALLYCKWIKLFYSRLGNKKSKKSFGQYLLVFMVCIRYCMYLHSDIVASFVWVLERSNTLFYSIVFNHWMF